jgi:RNA polymerase sigma-70 factor (ECF subfamily)
LLVIDVLSDELELVRCAVRGDSHAFGELYQRTLDLIYRYVYFRIGDVNDAEDLIEQTYLKAWQALPGYKPSGHPFVCWLYRIAQNLIMDYHRRKKTDAAVTKDLKLDCESYQPNVIKDIIEAEEAGMLARAISKLTEEQQQVILLRFVERLSYSEISRILDKSEGACRMLQNRALIALNQILNNNGQG